MQPLSIALVKVFADATEREQQLAEFLNVPLISNEEIIPAELSFYLQFTPQGLCLCDVDPSEGKPTIVDFASSQLESRVSDSLSQQNLIKALGLKKHPHPTVLDSMAGLGKDAYLMAMAGCQVHMVEKSKIVFALLRDGLERIQQFGFEELDRNLVSLQYVDFLDVSPRQQKFDLVYLDPMYQSANRKSKAKRDIERLQRLLGKEDNEATLLQHSIALAKRRVIVKRPKNAPSFASAEPDIVYKGSSARFDVYLVTT